MLEVRLDEEYAKLIESRYDYDTNETEEVSRKKVIHNESFYELLSNKINRSDQILPINCRYIKNLSDGSRIIVTEDAPKIRTCVFNLDFERMIERIKIEGNLKRFGLENFLEENQEPYNLRLSLPFIVYIFLIGSNELIRMNIAFRLAPISSLYDYLLMPNLLNISENLLVCLGNSIKQTEVPTLAELTDHTINRFWSNPFNFDYTGNYHLYEKTDGVSDLLTWSYYTSVNPMFIFKVKWKPYKLNLKRVINNLGNDNYNYKILNYYNISSIFKGQQQEELKEGLSFRNVVDSIYLMNSIAEIGDQIKFKSKKDVYIESFSTIRPKHDSCDTKATHINLEIGKKIVRYKLSKKFRRFLDKQLTSDYELKSVIISDNEVKKGDILYVPEDHLYAKVEKVRSAIDGIEEIKMKGRYYSVDNLKASVINKNNILINKTKILQDEYYAIYSLFHKPFSQLYNTNYKFDDLSLRRRELEVKFSNDDEEAFKIVNNDSQFSFIKTSELEKLPFVCRYGTSFIKGEFHKTKNHMLCNDYNSKVSIEDLVENGNLTETNFNIKSFDLDIEFNVGDKVIVPDWNNPIEMLTIKTITKIIWDEDSLIFDIKNLRGEQSSIKYYSTSPEGNTVKVGLVRKIQTSYKVIKTGEKIKCKEAGVPMFPKKDINIIIGFITDTGGEPLVLCSNCCTIWFSDLINKFDIISRKNVKYKKLNHAPINLNKIKLQSGDLIEYKNYPDKVSVISKHINHNRMECVFPLNNIFDRTFEESWFNLEPLVKDRYDFYGILNPRYSQRNIIESMTTSSYPNLHNLIIPKSDSRIAFPDIMCLKEDQPNV